jgi:hypothetical protein
MSDRNGVGANIRTLLPVTRQDKPTPVDRSLQTLKKRYAKGKVTKKSTTECGTNSLSRIGKMKTTVLLGLT